MRKFPILRDGVNKDLLGAVRAKVGAFLPELFDEEDLVQVDDIFSFSFGSATIQVSVVPWHSKDVLVKVFSYLAENVDPARACASFMRLNADVPMGSFSMTFDNSVMFSCSLPGRNLDRSELLGALQTVALYSDLYDDILKERYL